MTLSLDVSDSRAKLGRAQEHRGSLEAERVAFVNSDPYTLTFTPADPEKLGWASVVLTRSDPSENLTFALALGDMVHNLRCALDYLVTALAAASDALPVEGHLFPIFLNEEDYQTRVTGLRPALPGRGG